MKLQDWTRLVSDALRATSTSGPATLVVAAATGAGHDLDEHDLIELLVQWAAIALDPGGLHQLVGHDPDSRLDLKVPALYRLHGIETAASEVDRG